MIAVPQIPRDRRQFFHGLDAEGNLLARQVQFSDLSWGGMFGRPSYSTTANTIGRGKKSYSLDVNRDNIEPGCMVQCVALQNPVECWEYGLVVAKRTTVGDAEIDVIVSTVSQLTGTFAMWEIAVVSGPSIGVEHDTTAISSTSETVGTGTKTFTIEDTDKFFPEGATVLARDLENGGYMLTEVVSLSGTTLTLESYFTFGTGGVASTSWSFRLMDGPNTRNALYDSEDWGSITEAASGSSAGSEDYQFVSFTVTDTADYEDLTAAGSTGDYGAVT